jgi:hypothetical protein
MLSHKKLMAFDKVHGENIRWFALEMVDLCVGCYDGLQTDFVSWLVGLSVVHTPFCGLFLLCIGNEFIHFFLLKNLYLYFYGFVRPYKIV